MGITYIMETADRFRDERWHMTYAEQYPLYDPLLTQFKCGRCGLYFHTRDDFELHQKEKHNFLPPKLHLDGVMQPYIICIKNLEDIVLFDFENVQEVKVLTSNGWSTIRVDDFKKETFWSKKGRAEIRLIGKNKEETRHLLKIERTDEHEIEQANVEFRKWFAVGEDFSWKQIIEFENIGRSSNSHAYRSALADYLRGIKFRNGDIDASKATQESYKEVFNRAYSELKYHDDILSTVLVSLINLSKSDFTNRLPTRSDRIDILMAIFFELKNFGTSAIVPEITSKGVSPIAPTDRSIDLLLSLVDENREKFYAEMLDHMTQPNEMLANEFVLARILYLWKFSESVSEYQSKLISDLSHNVPFRKFLKIRGGDGKEEK